MSNRLYGPSGTPIAGNFITPNTPGAGTLAQVGPLPAMQTVAGTAETVIVNPALTTQPLLCSVPPGGPLEQLPWKFLWSGVLETAQSSTVTLKLYSGTSLTVGSDTLLGSSGAITAFSGKSNFVAELVDCVYDSISGKLTGKIQFVVNNVVVAAVALSNIVTGINNTNNPVLSLLGSVTFGTATAPNTIVTREFAIYES